MSCGTAFVVSKWERSLLEANPDALLLRTVHIVLASCSVLIHIFFVIIIYYNHIVYIDMSYFRPCKLVDNIAWFYLADASAGSKSTTATIFASIPSRKNVECVVIYSPKECIDDV